MPLRYLILIILADAVSVANSAAVILVARQLLLHRTREHANER